MPEKISVDEEKRILPTSYIEKMEKKQVIDSTLGMIKEGIVNKLKTTILPMGQDKLYLNEIEEEIMDNFNDEVLDDLYGELPITPLVKNYIKRVKDYDLKREQFITIVIDGFIDFIDKANIAKGGEIKTEFLEEGDIMPEDERKKFIDNINPYILRWQGCEQKTRSKSLQNAMTHLLFTKFATTKMKFIIIDEQFFNIVGQRVLTKWKEDAEKRKEEKNEPNTSI